MRAEIWACFFLWKETEMLRDAPKILGQVTVYTWEGNPANISCEVEAHPTADMLWFRDGIQLPNANSSNVKIYNTPSVSYLEINPDSQNDFGSYNCTATNIMGTESKEFILIQAGDRRLSDRFRPDPNNCSRPVP
ncbi:hypothetical protein WMY93_007406 [Mugilogobius chulae]|uniref:Ig-like domain-containing protein n=1 Tax=Mugilogobius chulae TaxID=88201 RepID=A0AAW0PD33_9GOBI